MNDAVLDFPFVAELPKREKSRLAKMWDAFNEMKELQKRHGSLVPVQVCAALGGVSNQRICQLADEGRLVRIEFHGHPYIAEDSFVEWASSERKSGRPLGVNNQKDLAKMVVGALLHPKKFTSVK